MHHCHWLLNPFTGRVTALVLSDYMFLMCPAFVLFFFHPNYIMIQMCDAICPPLLPPSLILRFLLKGIFLKSTNILSAPSSHSHRILVCSRGHGGEEDVDYITAAWSYWDIWFCRQIQEPRSGMVVWYQFARWANDFLSSALAEQSVAGAQTQLFVCCAADRGHWAAPPCPMLHIGQDGFTVKDYKLHQQKVTDSCSFHWTEALCRGFRARCWKSW